MPTVTLIQPHTHRGRQYQPGDEIDVSDSTAHWLEKRTIIAPLTEQPPEQPPELAPEQPPEQTPEQPESKPKKTRKKAADGES